MRLWQLPGRRKGVKVFAFAGIYSRARCRRYGNGCASHGAQRRAPGLDIAYRQYILTCHSIDQWVRPPHADRSVYALSTSLFGDIIDKWVYSDRHLTDD